MDGCKGRKVGRAKKSRTQELGLEWGAREKNGKQRERGIENERERKKREKGRGKK